MKKILLGLVAVFALSSFSATVYAADEGGDKAATEKPAKGKKGGGKKKDKAEDKKDDKAAK